MIRRYIFWLSLFGIAYTYFLYPAVLFVLYCFSQAWRDLRYLVGRRSRRARVSEFGPLPYVSIVIAAYNEELVLPGKIANLRSLDYPSDRVEIILVSDGSNDGTNRILSEIKDKQFRTVLLAERSGKANALNHGVAAASHEILVFSDASTLLAPAALKMLVRHFAEPKAGAVCGALQFKNSLESQQTEGVYWKYESMLRLMEARLGATLTASGAMYAVRRDCYRPIPTGCIVDDLIIPMNVRRAGFGVKYDPEAIAYEEAAESVKGEFKRRVRIALGSFLALFYLAPCLLDPMTAFAFVSHKFLRWILPLLQLALLASNLALWSQPPYRWFLMAQMLFYLWAILGMVFKKRLLRVRFALVPYFLTAMNIAYLIGLIKAFGSRQKATWDRVT